MDLNDTAEIPVEINRNEVPIDPYATAPEKFTLHHNVLMIITFCLETQGLQQVSKGHQLS